MQLHLVLHHSGVCQLSVILQTRATELPSSRKVELSPASSCVQSYDNSCKVLRVSKCATAHTSVTTSLLSTVCRKSLQKSYSLDRKLMRIVSYFAGTSLSCYSVSDAKWKLQVVSITKIYALALQHPWTRWFVYNVACHCCCQCYG